MAAMAMVLQSKISTKTFATSPATSGKTSLLQNSGPNFTWYFAWLGLAFLQSRLKLGALSLKQSLWVEVPRCLEQISVAVERGPRFPMQKLNVGWTCFDSTMMYNEDYKAELQLWNPPAPADRNGERIREAGSCLICLSLSLSWVKGFLWKFQIEVGKCKPAGGAWCPSFKVMVTGCGGFWLMRLSLKSVRHFFISLGPKQADTRVQQIPLIYVDIWNMFTLVFPILE